MALQYPLLPAPQDGSNAPSPAPETRLTDTDLDRLRRSLDSSVSDNTRAMYNSAWRGFQSWTQARGALALPASPALVAAYLAYLAEERHLSVATVRLHKAALAAVHRAAGHEDPTDNEGVKRVMKGIARAYGRSQKQARPLTAEALAAVKATARGRRPLGDGKRQGGGIGGTGLPGGAGWTLALLVTCCGTGCCAGPRRRSPDAGGRLNSGTTGQHCCTYLVPRRTRKPRDQSSISAVRPRRPCRPSFPKREPRTRI